MAKVYTRNGKLWIGFVYKGVQCRESLRLDENKANLKHAERLKTLIDSEIGLNQFNYRQHFPKSKRCALFDEYRPVNATVSESLDDWFNLVEPNLSHTTAKEYKCSINHNLKPVIGDLLLADLQTRHIKQWMAQQTHISAKRINNVLIPLRGMLDEAFCDGRIERNPAEKIHNLRINRKEPDPFTLDEIDKILAACKEPQHKNLFQFAFYTGLRTGELIALSWEDFDEVKQCVFIRHSTTAKQTKAPKTSASGREVTLLPPAWQALQAQKKHTQLQDKNIFFYPYRNEPWAEDAQIRERAWRPTLKYAGVRYRYPYQTRHTFACLMLTAGENPAWIAAQMGHKDWGMIRKIYARWMPSAAPDAGDKFKAIYELHKNTQKNNV